MNRFLVFLIFGMYAGLCAAETDIKVFTDSKNPVANTGEYRVFHLDGIERIEAQLSQGLPLNPEAANAQARARIQASPSLESDLLDAFEGIQLAWQLGVTKLPAVVLENRWVIYGENDVRKAVERLVKREEGTR